MPSSYLRETVENWVSDFVDAEAARALAPVVREYASEFLVTLLVDACEFATCAPGEVAEPELRRAFLGAVARTELPASVHEGVPDACAAFLAELERVGRVADGRSAGLALRAARGAYLAASGVVRTPLRRPAPKISPNDPCPCGSGRKYKKCCSG